MTSIQEDLKRKFEAENEQDEDQLAPNNKQLKIMPSDSNDDALAMDEQSSSSNVSRSSSVDLTNVEIELEQKAQQPTTPAIPQRKKPGRKPNPASPALRKAQNRAAQRAFRERKERHLRDLENTIKSLREVQYEGAIKYQKEVQQLRTVIDTLENECSYWKDVAFSFECALNNIHGNTEPTSKIKAALALSARTLVVQPPSLSMQTSAHNVNNMFGLLQQPQSTTSHQLNFGNHQQMLNVLDAAVSMTTDIHSAAGVAATKSFLPSPTNSSAMMSPESSPQTPPTINNIGSLSPSTNYSLPEEMANELNMSAAEAKQLNNVTKSRGNNTGNNGSSTIDPSFLAATNQSPATNADYSSIFFDEMTDQSFLQDYELAYAQKQNEAIASLSTSDPQDPVTQQLIALSILVGAPDLSPVNPKVRYPLTPQQIYYLQQPHDPRIDMIPCLHLRARMIQHRERYDPYALFDLLIRKAKCHGDTMDPDSWEMPEEFFELYKFLVFQHCRLKSTLYRQYGMIPKGGLSNLLKTGTSGVYIVS